MKESKNRILFIMGVSSSGKTTVGELLSQKLGLPFFDGDDFHTKQNVKKMASGTPLTDLDRKDWLLNLNSLAKEHLLTGAVIACSALKESYREILTDGIGKKAGFIYLKGTFDEILYRMRQRKGHFMPVDLLKSQFETLEPPEEALIISIADTPQAIVANILDKLKSTRS